MDNFYSILIDIGVLSFFGFLYYTWQKRRIIKASMDQIKEEISELVYELHEYLDGKEQSKDYEKLNSYALGLEESLKIDELEIIEKSVNSFPEELPESFKGDISRIKTLF